MKNKWFSPAIINAYRIWPRLMISLYGFMLYDTTSWFMGLEDPNNAQSIFMSAIIGAASVFFGFYVKSGPNSEDTETVQNMFEKDDE